MLNIHGLIARQEGRSTISSAIIKITGGQWHEAAARIRRYPGRLIQDVYRVAMMVSSPLRVNRLGTSSRALMIYSNSNDLRFSYNFYQG